MSVPFLKRWFRSRLDSSLVRRELTRRPILEQLEERVLLDAGLPPALVVGRTLSSYFVGGIQNNQETITYTVYNEQANPVTGVLLTDTLQPGVTFQSASTLPDRSGQNLAWSLGSINGFDRASVTLTVNLANPAPLQLDTGAQAFAMLDANAISSSAPAARLLQGSSPNLASTPDANSTDPFIQAKAAELGYNAQNIFDYLHNDIGYNSYNGSLRGARGTLWSSAGNALDVASLGVALMRASGIPAQYVSGTLSRSQAQQLILSMFPASYQTVGYIPDGAQTSDPASDPTLLAETESHYWFQFDTGSGMTDADPLLAGATIGQTFTTATGTFTEVPDNLRAKTAVSVTAEIYSQAAAAFGMDPFTKTVVLDQTFNDVDLVGRPLTVGNLISSNGAASPVFGVVWNTYSPYIQVGDEAYPDPSHDEMIRGQDYQEQLTNFPLGSQILTGLFLNITLSGPQNTPQTYERTLVDRIGYAVRHSGVSTSLAIITSGPPTLSNLDLWTINALPGFQSPYVIAAQGDALAHLQSQLSELAPGDPLGHAPTLEREIASNSNENVGILFATTSDQALADLETGYRIKSYYAAPRLLITTSKQTNDQLSISLDLLKNDARDVPAPGQVVSTALFFEVIRGLFESTLEGQIVAGATGQPVLSISQVFDAMAAQGASLVEIDPGNLQNLDSLTLSATAKARITQAVNAGRVVYAPSQMVQVNGKTTVGWLETDWSSGHTISVMEDGEHQALVEYTATFDTATNRTSAATIGFLDGIAKTQLTFVSSFLKQLANGTEFTDAVKAAKIATAKAIINDFVKTAVKFLMPTPKDVGTLYKLAWDVIKAFNAVSLGNLISQRPVNPYDIGQEVFKLVWGRVFSPKDAMEVTATFDAWILVGEVVGFAWIIRSFPDDPPVYPFLSTDLSALPQPNVATSQVQPTPSLTPGSLFAAVMTASVSIANSMTATWSTTGSSSNFVAVALNATSGTVKDATGVPVGSGGVALAAAGVPVGISGNVLYSVNGTGGLSFYGPAETSLGVSGNWTGYTATVTGNVTLTLTTDSLLLNGKPLPAGTYTITTNAATLSGSGLTTSPNFSGSVSIKTKNSTIDLGPGTGTVQVGGKPVDPTNGITLTGYTGSISVAAGSGTNLDTVTLNGNAANVLTVSATPAALTTDQNTPVTFQANLNTSFADTYNLTAQAPPGWNVTIDTAGKISVTPASGLQRGTYPIQVAAQSTTNPDLVAQTTVNVTITPTVPGITLAVQPDPLFTVPFNGAQVPTAFQAIIHNNGPAADTYNLSFSNVPSGFTLLNSGTSVTIPAGQTGGVGVYLQPTGTLLPPGTPLSFSVTTTSTTNPAITKAVTESFPMPAVDGVTLVSNPPSLSSSPGTPTTATLTLQNVGNVPENISLTATGPTGLRFGGLVPVTLAVGQTRTVTITLTPPANAALNSTLAATIMATYGPTATSQITTVQLDLLVRSAQTVAIAQASVAAAQANSYQLATTLSELGDAVSRLQAAPTDATLLGRVQFELGNLSTLLSADPALASFVSQLQPIQAKANAGDTAGMLPLLPAFFTSLTSVLAIEATQQFSVSLSPSQVTMEPGQGKDFSVQLTNSGNDPVTLNLSAAGLPSNVAVSFDQTQVTVAAGATASVPMTLSQTLVSSKLFTLSVTAAASLVQHTATAVVDVRPAVADLLGVTVNPASVNLGDPVSVTAQVFNTANTEQNVLAHIDIRDTSGNVVSTPLEVPFSLVPATGNITLNLGQVATTGLATGVYTVRVSLRESDDSPLPGQWAQAIFAVGQLVTASVAASSAILPPGTSTVSTTITVTNNTSSGGGSGASEPVSVWKADGNANDSVGGNNGTLVNGAGFLPGVTGAPGDEAFTCSGSGQYITVANTPNLDFGIGDFTIDLWAKFNNLTPPPDFDGGPGSYELFHKVTGLVPNDQTYFLEWNAPNALRFMVRAGESNQNDLVVPTALVAGQWYHITAVRQGNTNRIYLDGALLGSQTAGNNVDTGSGGIVRIGATAPNGTAVTRYLNGSLDDIALYNRALSAAEIQAMSVEVTHNLPAIGYNVDPTTISPAPTSSSASQVVWDAPILSGSNPNQFQFSGTVNDMVPGEVRQISLGTTVTANVWASGGGPTSGGAAPIRVDLYNDFTEDYGHSLSFSNYVKSFYTPDIKFGPDIHWGWFPLAPDRYYFGADFTGWFNVPAAGTYTFNLGSDDGAYLFIDGALRINNGGNHDPGYNSADVSLTAGVHPFEVQFRETGWAPSGVDLVLPSGVSYVSEVYSVTIPLPPLTVAAEHIISLDQATQTADRGGQTTYIVELTNPFSTGQTYTLSSDGLDGLTTDLPASITVAAGQTMSLALDVTVPPGITPGTRAFQVFATTAAGAVDSVEGQLTVSPQVALNSLAVHLALQPLQTTAGQGTPATYTVRVANEGDTVDTYNLAGSFPTGVTAAFSPSTVTVPPGLSNFRDVTLTLTPASATTAGSYPFQVTATSTTKASVTGIAQGTVKVVSQGVQAALSPTTAAPGSTFNLTVTNTGKVKDTFSLSLGGPGAQFSRLALTQVTLAAGASKVVAVTTTAVRFALPGALSLVAIAKSASNPAVRASATSAIQVPSCMGMTARLSPSVQVIPLPGGCNFLVLINNIGNQEDSYKATISSCTGPVTAQLMGMDGRPTQTIPLFRLPGLATGVLLLKTNLKARATGTVTIEIDSLTDPKIKAKAQAQVSSFQGRRYGPG